MVDNSFITDDERFDAGDTVVGRRSGESKATNHGTLDDKIHLSQRSRRALPFEDFEEIAVIGLCFIRIALLQGICNAFRDRSAQASIWIPPYKSVLFSGRADNSLSVLIHFGIIVFLQCVFVLGIHIVSANLKGIQFVRADAPVEYLLSTSFGIEEPCSILFHNRNRHRPVPVSYNKNGPIRLFRVDGY